MVSKVRLLYGAPMRLTRPYHSGNSTRQVLVERRRTFWSKDLFYYGVPFFAALGYLYWSSSDVPAHSRRINITNGSDSNAEGAEKHGTQIFIRLTSPRQVTKVRGTQLNEQELERVKLARDTVHDREKMQRMSEELMKSVNSRIKGHSFYGVGIPNTLSMVSRKVAGMPFHHYEADGILLTADGIYWTSRKIPARAKNNFDKITSYPWMAFISFFHALRFHWTSPKTKPQVISSPTASGRQPAGKAPVQDANSDSSSAEGEEESTQRTTEPGSPSVSTKTTVDSETSQTADSEVSSRPKFNSTGNHVDVISSFLSQQKEAVRQSNGLVPTGSANAFLKAFAREFVLQRARQQFQNYDVPGGNIIFECILIVNGPKRHLVLAVDADYDVTTDTWGPVFLEPLQGLRTQAVHESARRGKIFGEKSDK